MGWENRKGREYYYRKVRQGRRVMSQYIGGAEVAHAIAALEQGDHIVRAVEREQEGEQRAAERAVDAGLDRLAEQVQVLATAALLNAGYHQHHGSWRKRRRGAGST